MTLKLSKSFVRQAANLKPAQQRRLRAALILFQQEPMHPDLYNHTLSDEWHGHRSIAFGGDWRAHYTPVDEDTAHFVACGTHGQLYE